MATKPLYPDKAVPSETLEDSRWMTSDEKRAAMGRSTSAERAAARQARIANNPRFAEAMQRVQQRTPFASASQIDPNNFTKEEFRQAQKQLSREGIMPPRGSRLYEAIKRNVEGTIRYGADLDAFGKNYDEILRDLGHTPPTRDESGRVIQSARPSPTTRIINGNLANAGKLRMQPFVQEQLNPPQVAPQTGPQPFADMTVDPNQPSPVGGSGYYELNNPPPGINMSPEQWQNTPGEHQKLYWDYYKKTGAPPRLPSNYAPEQPFNRTATDGSAVGTGVQTTVPGVTKHDPSKQYPTTNGTNAPKTTTMDKAQPFAQAQAGQNGSKSQVSANPQGSITDHQTRSNTQIRSQRSGFQGNRRFFPFAGRNRGGR